MLQLPAVLLLDARWYRVFLRGLVWGELPERWLLERRRGGPSTRGHAAAGAELVLSCTFNLASPKRLKDAGLAANVETLAETAVRLARRSAPGRLVAGAVGPTGLITPQKEEPSAETLAECTATQAGRSRALALISCGREPVESGRGADRPLGLQGDRAAGGRHAQPGDLRGKPPRGLGRSARDAFHTWLRQVPRPSHQLRAAQCSGDFPLRQATGLGVPSSPSPPRATGLGDRAKGLRAVARRAPGPEPAGSAAAAAPRRPTWLRPASSSGVSRPVAREVRDQLGIRLTARSPPRAGPQCVDDDAVLPLVDLVEGDYPVFPREMTSSRRPCSAGRPRNGCSSSGAKAERKSSRSHTRLLVVLGEEVRESRDKAATPPPAVALRAAALTSARRAFDDVPRLADFLAENDEEVACETLELFRSAFAPLELHPFLGRPAEHGLRELVISRGKTGYVRPLRGRRAEGPRHHPRTEAPARGGLLAVSRIPSWSLLRGRLDATNSRGARGPQPVGRRGARSSRRASRLRPPGARRSHRAKSFGSINRAR